MIFINQTKVPDVNMLYFFYNLEGVKIVDIFKKKFEVKDITKIDDEILLFDPSLENLKLILDLDKSVTIVMSYVNEDYVPLLGRDNIKKVLIFEDLEATFLDSRKINKFELVKPTMPISESPVEKLDDIAVFTSIHDMKPSDNNILYEISILHRVIYYGYKVVEDNSDFKTLMGINYSPVKIRPFPIFNLKELIQKSLFTLDFSSNKFPITIFSSLEYKNIPIIFGNKYRRWIATEFQNPELQDLKEVFKNSSNNFKLEIIDKQREIFKEYFKNHKPVNEVLN